MKLSNEQDAIKQAVEAGWRKGIKIDFRFINEGFVEVIGLESETDDDLTEREKLTLAEILQDPAFWQALGRARGWRDYGEFETKRKSDYQAGIVLFYGDEHQYHALRYFETLLTSPEKIKEYWENLP